MSVPDRPGAVDPSSVRDGHAGEHIVGMTRREVSAELLPSSAIVWKRTYYTLTQCAKERTRYCGRALRAVLCLGGFPAEDEMTGESSVLRIEGFETLQPQANFAAACSRMAVRKFSEAIIRNCIRHIADLARFLRRSLDTAIAEYVRRFQVRMIENSARPPKRNSATSAIRFFFDTTLSGL